VSSDDTFLTAAENGYGKRTDVAKYRLQSRGGKGVINMKTTERNGSIVGILKVTNEHDIVMMTQNGIIIRMAAKTVSVIGRNTQGVRLIRLGEGDRLVSIANVAKETENNGDTGEDESREKTV